MGRFGRDTLLRPDILVPSCAISPEYVAGNRSKLLTDLYGIIVGISLDGEINADELLALGKWSDECAMYSDDSVMRDALALVANTLVDERVDDQERAVLLSYTRPFVVDGHNVQDTVCFQQLIGILKGVSADRRINEREAESLRDWVPEHEEMFPNKEFAHIRKELDAVSEDGVVNSDEEEKLLMLFRRIVNPVGACRDDICYEGKKFVLTGNFTCGSKAKVEAVIVGRGGKISKTVSGKVSYVVVGAEGSESYHCSLASIGVSERFSATWSKAESACRSTARRSGVTSPMMRIARPGPGEG